MCIYIYIYIYIYNRNNYILNKRTLPTGVYIQLRSSLQEIVALLILHSWYHPTEYQVVIQQVRHLGRGREETKKTTKNDIKRRACS